MPAKGTNSSSESYAEMGTVDTKVPYPYTILIRLELAGKADSVCRVAARRRNHPHDGQTCSHSSSVATTEREKRAEVYDYMPWVLGWLQARLLYGSWADDHLDEQPFA